MPKLTFTQFRVKIENHEILHEFLSIIQGFCFVILKSLGLRWEIKSMVLMIGLNWVFWQGSPQSNNQCQWM